MKKENKYYNLTAAIFGSFELGNIFDCGDEDFDAVFATLTTVESNVVKERYLEHKTLQKIGDELGVGRERVRQIEAKALRKMRHPNRLVYIRLGKAEAEARKAKAEADAKEREAAHKGLLDNDPRKRKIEELDLSVRSFNGLMRAGIRTAYDITTLTEDDLVHIRNIGNRCIEEIKAKLAEYGLSLKAE